MKKIIIILVLITIIAFLITGILIVSKKTNQVVIDNKDSGEIIKKEEPKEYIKLYKEYHTPIKDGIRGVDYRYTYSTNALDWNLEFYEDDKIAGYYYQISGLKDKKVEESINNQLKEEAMKYAKAYREKVEAFKKPQKGDYSYYGYYFKYLNGKIYDNYDDSFFDLKGWKAFFNQCVVSSFSNVICVATGSFNKDNCYPFSGERVRDTWLCIDLNTGKEIQIEAIFGYDVDILSIVRNIIYRTVPNRDSYKSDAGYEKDENGEVIYEYAKNQRFEEIDLEKLDKLMKKFKYTEDIDFYFSPIDFGFKIDDTLYHFHYYNLDGKIAIYNRFLSKNSLFENDNRSLNDLAVYKNYFADNTLKKHVIRKDSSGVICDYTIYSIDYDENIDRQLIEKAASKIDSFITKEIEYASKIKKNEDQVVVLEYLFQVSKNDTVVPRNGYEQVSDEMYNKISSLIDTTQIYYTIDYSESRCFLVGKKEYDDGIIQKYDLLRSLYYKDFNSKDFEELNNRIDAMSLFEEVLPEDYIYNHIREELTGNTYDFKDNTSYKNVDISKVLKDGSEEGIKEFVNTVYEYILERSKNKNWPDPEMLRRNMDPNNFTISKNKISFRYYNEDSGYYNNEEFNFIKKADGKYDYFNLPYPIPEYEGI